MAQKTKAPRKRRSLPWRLMRGALLAVAVLLCLAVGAVAWVWVRLEPLSLARADALSVTVLDRNDRLLRAYAAADGRWRLPVEVKDVDPRYLAMLLAFEDKRFRSHSGVDVWALLRAGWQLVRHQRIVSGGSTITMQVVRLLLGAARAHAVGQDPAGPARPVAGAALLQGRDPAPLPAARTVRRQPGGRARRLARLLRQGAAPPVRRRGGDAGGDPAVAGVAPPGPLARGNPARPQPRAHRACWPPAPS